MKENVSAEFGRSRAPGYRAVNKWVNKQTCREFRLEYALTISQTHLLVGTETTHRFASNACVKISTFDVGTQKL
jgi:hypothetical protein